MENNLLICVITQIKYEFYEYPFSTIGIHAKEEVSSGLVTRLTSDIKYVIPDSRLCGAIISKCVL